MSSYPHAPGDSRARTLFDRLCREGEAAIDDLINTRAAEELFLDFKRSNDDGKGTHLHDADRKNLAKAVSGFGNSEGGVIVWGVECKSNASAKHPITDAVRFVSWLRDVISGCTVPPHPGVDSQPIVLPGARDGFAVTYVPSSLYCPHKTANDRRYYLRIGSSFGPVPHAILAGLFGRRPQPLMVLELLPEEARTQGKGTDGTTVFVPFDVAVRNYSFGIARGVYVTARPVSPGPKCKVLLGHSKYISLRGQVRENFVTSEMPQEGLLVISEPEFLLPPEGMVHAVQVSMYLLPPFENDLVIDFQAGCEEGLVSRFACSCSAGRITELYARVLLEAGGLPGGVVAEYLAWSRTA